MARYSLKEEKNGDTRRVEVTRERLHFKVGPLLVCLLMAFLIWLYLAGRDIRRNNEAAETATTTAGTTVSESADPAEETSSESAPEETTGPEASAPGDGNT